MSIRTMAVLGVLILWARQKQITFGELTRCIGMQPTTFSLIVDGRGSREFTYVEQVKIAEVLGIHDKQGVEWLFTRVQLAAPLRHVPDEPVKVDDGSFLFQPK